MMILSQAAPFDMATTSGIAQSVTLRFVDGAGAAKDISGHEFRCAVRGPGAAAIKCEPVDANTALLSWSPLKAGTHAYDLFMTSPDGAERPLIKGEIQAASRVTPPGSKDVVTIGDVKIMIPDAAEGEVKIIDPSVDAAERAESAAQEASNARNDAQNAKKEAEKSAERAATSATASANSATAAQQALAAMPQVDASGNMTLAGNITAAGGTFAGAVNANGGVRVPAPDTASNALSMDAILRELARMDWVRLRGGYECVFSGPIEYLTRMMSLNQKHSGYASLSEAVLNNCLYRVVQLAPSSGVSFLGLVSAPWKMGGLLGTSKDTSRAGAVGWLIDNADAASVCLGTTGQGYSFETNKTSQCYAHPVHWNNSSSALWTDYRLPYYHSVNSSSAKDPCPGFQVTIYGKNYLGSQSSCLVRGTDYGREAENTQYIWALVPKVANLVVAMAPRDAENDHAYVMNRWELFVNGSYVMPMTAGFCGTGHTACVQETVKTHEVSSAVRVGLRMQGVLVNQGRLPGSETALNQLGAVIRDDVTARPVPVVEASALEVDAGGGEVALSISSPLNEAIYVLNDTMCGHDSTAVWCSQSAESTEAGGGEVVLTLAANESGEARQVWAFVGHHYAQAAVIKINQLA